MKAFQVIVMLLTVGGSLSGCGKTSKSSKCDITLPTGYSLTDGVPTFTGLNSIVNVSETSIRLSWDHADEQLLYLIYEKTATSRKEVAKVPAPLGMYLLSGLTAGESKTYEMVSIDTQCQPTDPSDEITHVVGALKNEYSTDFDGTDDYVSIETLDEVFGSATISAFSVSLWVKTHAAPAQYDGILAATNATYTNGFGVYWESPTTLGFFVNSQAANLAVSAAVTPTDWNHVVATYDVTPMNQNLKIYVNGVLVGTDDYRANVMIPAEALEIGRMNSSANSLNGRIDEVAIWDEALDASEVAELYHLGSPTELLFNQGDYNSVSGLIGWWKMGDGSTYPSLNDETGNHSGTLTNMTSSDWVSDVP